MLFVRYNNKRVYYAALIFVIIIINVLTAIRLHINNNHYFKVFFINISKL